jgi:hydroxymethylpyrimidine/phosphomethylpyrimidine kinase
VDGVFNCRVAAFGINPRHPWRGNPAACGLVEVRMPIERTRSREAWPAALTIAGSDSGGGAGIQADLKTFAALGVFGTSAITAVTAQNTFEVRDVQVIDTPIVESQIRAVYDDIHPRAAKTGMLANTEIVLTVCRVLDDLVDLSVVVDPVAFTSTGARLLTDDAFEALRDELIRRSVLATPNLREAEALSGVTINSRDDMRAAGKVLLERGANAVLVKGGHRIGDADDLFMSPDQEVWLAGEHIETTCTHGTGCSLSAATAAGLARGLPLLQAVREAKAFVTEGIRHGYVVGKGHSPINHFHRYQAMLEGSTP